MTHHYINSLLSIFNSNVVYNTYSLVWYIIKCIAVEILPHVMNSLMAEPHCNFENRKCTLGVFFVS